MSSCSSCIETTLMLGVQLADILIRCSIVTLRAEDDHD